MKKLSAILAIVVVALCAFGLISMRTSAQRGLFAKGSADERELAKGISLAFLRDHALSRSVGDPDDYVVKRVEIDELGMAHTHVQQRINGVPVWEGEAIVHLAPDGTMSNMTEALKETIAVDTVANFTPKEAIDLVQDEYRGRAKATERPQVELFIFRGEEGDHLAYRIETPRLDGSPETSAPVVFVDAHTGKRLFEYDN